MVAAASLGLIVYVVLRDRGGYREWDVAGMNFVLPEWREKEVIRNVSFGAVELIKEDRTAGLAVRWERQRVQMAIPVQARMVRIIGNLLRCMTGREATAEATSEDVSVQVGPHKGRRIEFTFDAGEVQYVASVILWTCSRTQRVITFGVFDEDGAELARVEKRFLGSVDCHARPVHHKEKIRLSAQLPGDWAEMVFTGSTKTFASGDEEAFFVLAAFASSGDEPAARDALAMLDFFASRQFNVTLEEPEAEHTYFRTLGHPGAEARARVLERGRHKDSEVRVWLWRCEQDRTDYMALFLGYGPEAVKLADPVMSTLRCHAAESRPQKGWRRVKF